MTNEHHEPREESRIFSPADPPEERLGEQGQVVRTESECRECGRDLGAGYLCDDCDTVEVLEE